MDRFTIHFRPFTLTFTQVKVKKVLPHRVNFTSSRIIILTQKCYCYYYSNKLTVSASSVLYSVFKFKSRRILRIYFFFLIILQEQSWPIQLAHISKSYLSFWYVPELSHSVHWGINPPLPQKHPPLSFLRSPQQIVQAHFLSDSPNILFFGDTLL